MDSRITGKRAKAPARLDTGCYSAAGRQRERNEDACGLPPRGADQARLGTLLVVADGVGGMPGGAVASQQAAQDLQALYYAGFGPKEPGERLRYCVEAVNAINRLHSQPGEPAEGYLSTLVAAVAAGDQIWVGNVGDSRAYLIQKQTRRRMKLTEDHSQETQLAKRGLAGESGGSQAEGVITRAIGLEARCQVDTYHYAWSPGDRLVLCSDGLAQVPEQDMVDLALGQPAAAAAERLVARAIEVDGSDNCTAAVAGWLEVPPRRREAGAKPRPNRRHRSPAASRTQTLLPLLLGLLLGWLSAALLAIYWLEAAGITNLF
jgi:protein phosphatase